MSQFSEFEDFTIFAVQYRYEAYDEGEEKLDRKDVMEKVELLLEHVRAIVAGTE